MREECPCSPRMLREYGAQRDNRAALQAQAVPQTIFSDNRAGKGHSDNPTRFHREQAFFCAAKYLKFCPSAHYPLRKHRADAFRRFRK